MAGWWIAPFQENVFLRHALVAGLLVALLGALVGTFVVLRGLAFIGDALAHGALPGVAGALLLGAPGMLGAMVGSAVMIVGVSLVTHWASLSSDTAIGLLFAGMLALGVMVVSGSDTFTGDIVRILFGEILGVRDADLVALGLAVVASALIVTIAWRPFLLLCFEPELAAVAGFPVRVFHTLMLLTIGIAVVVSFEAVGTLLVFGMLIAPAATGTLLGQRVLAMIGWSAVFGSSSVYLGLLLSYHRDVAAGAAIVVVAVSQFFVVLAIRSVRGRSPVRHAPIEAPR